MLIFFISLLIGFLTSTIVLGDLALERFKPDRAKVITWSGAAALAVLLLAAVGKIPVFGVLVAIAALLAGLGALVLQVKAFHQRVHV
jgi:hypothetical protein